MYDVIQLKHVVSIQIECKTGNEMTIYQGKFLSLYMSFNHNACMTTYMYDHADYVILFVKQLMA